MAPSTMPGFEVFHDTAMALPTAVMELYRVTDTMWLQEDYPCSKSHNNLVFSSGLANNSAKSNLVFPHSVLAKMSNTSSFDIQTASPKENKPDGADGMQSTSSDVLAMWCRMEKNHHGKILPSGAMKDLVYGWNDKKNGRNKSHGILKMPDAFLNLDPMRSKRHRRVRFDEDSIRSTSTKLASVGFQL